MKKGLEKVAIVLPVDECSHHVFFNSLGGEVGG